MNVLDGTVNYTGTRPLVDDSICTLNRETGWDAVLGKYRISVGSTLESSNATDAAAFHRDVKALVPDHPIHTLVMYLDDAALEVVPGTHQNTDIGTLDYACAPSERIDFRPGDAVLFHASLMHRGVFVGAGTPRRVVQFFDVVPTPRQAQYWFPRILHLWNEGSATKGIMAARLSKVPGMSRTVHFLQELADARAVNLDLPPGVTIVSNESWRNRLPPSSEYDGQYHPGNLYVGNMAPLAPPEINRQLRRSLDTKVYREIACVVATIALVGAVVYVTTRD